MQEPHELHWKVAKCILRYVQGTITFGIHYATDSTLYLIGFIDSDWAGDNTDRKSTSGYSLSLGSRPICWSRKKQASISLSSAEAEYRGVVNITIQAMWLQHFLTELGIQFHRSIVIWCDNLEHSEVLQRSSSEAVDEAHRDPHALHLGLST
jgi:hypothetical protein